MSIRWHYKIFLCRIQHYWWCYVSKGPRPGRDWPDVPIWWSHMVIKITSVSKSISKSYSDCSWWMHRFRDAIGLMCSWLSEIGTQVLFLISDCSHDYLCRVLECVFGVLKSELSISQRVLIRLPSKSYRQDRNFTHYNMVDVDRIQDAMSIHHTWPYKFTYCYHTSLSKFTSRLQISSIHGHFLSTASGTRCLYIMHNHTNLLTTITLHYINFEHRFQDEMSIHDTQL